MGLLLFIIHDFKLKRECRRLFSLYFLQNKFLNFNNLNNFKYS